LPDRPRRPYLPQVFFASSGQDRADWSLDIGTGILLRDLDLATLVGVAESGSEVLAVDLDSVDGLNADDAGARFLTERLGVRIVMTRRHTIASLVADAGGLGLVRVYAFDSTGLKRALESHAVQDGVGTVISPGPVLSHLTPDDLVRLPRPVVAYGLIDAADRARQLLSIADSVVVGPDVARALSDGVWSRR